ncbi:hypothetical protein [Chitinophaga qingshengii]|uniref:DUF4595 domain-containing protein n=1 Tax=Chitinophaga qingshengii TaxID=1569794 RepID=A0ABR7TPS2_9BACT|nr:hypothetical protein [Chitinophaga qingshengii]MBC9932476.1 hypothetical protein [Chitinophaga qingshengii]
MPYLRKYGLLYLLATLWILAPSCQCKKEHINPPEPPPPPQDVYLVTSISLNHVPKDSFVYNDQQQLIQHWDYNTTYRQWQNYITFDYNADGYVKTARYYNENDNTEKSLSQQDQLSWNTGKLLVYTTRYRELGQAISGYDTTTLLVNANKQFTLSGSKDTFVFNIGIYGNMVAFKEYAYQQQDVGQFTAHNYMNVTGAPLIFEEYRYTMTYGNQPNPLYPYLSKNPLLLQIVTADLQNKWKGYPYLASEHLVTSFRYEEANGDHATIPVTYTPFASSAYPQDQLIGSDIISYRYRVIKHQ